MYLCKRMSLVLAALYLYVGMAMAQTTISGTVFSADDNEPLMGANILVEGTQKRAITDLDGKFTINVPAGAILEFSALNYVTQELTAGKTIVISGNFSISRDEMKRTIEANGGRNSSSVSGKTSFLLAGSKPGPEKVKKAQDLGVRIISEEEFFEMLPAGEHVVEDNAEPTLF